MVYKPQNNNPRARAGHPICAVANGFCGQQEPRSGRVLKAYFATLEEQSHQHGDGQKKTTIYTAQFRRAGQAVPGRRIWLIVETLGLEGVPLEVIMRCAKKDELLAQDAALKVIRDGTEQETLRVEVGCWTGGGRYQHSEAYRNWAIIELQPGPAGATERKAMAKKLEACMDHRGLFYVDVRAITGIPTEYANEAPGRTANTHDKSILLNEDGKYLELLSCCRADITFAQLADVFPGAPADKVQAVADEFNRKYTVNGRQQRLFEIFHVDSCLRRAHFFAQAKVESKTVGGRELMGAFEGESFNYRVSRLLDGFTFSFLTDPAKPHLTEAALTHGKGPYTHIYPRTKRRREVPDTQEANQKALANIVNMDVNRPVAIRLGNTIEGDGWKFRGHGILQLTGRENFTNAQNWLDSVIPDNSADLINCPDYFSAFQVVATGGYFWAARSRLYLIADQGTTNTVVDSITRVINSGMKGKTERQEAFTNLKTVFRTSNCLLIP